MSEKSLTAEQKEFISSLAVNTALEIDVDKLRKIKNAMLDGMSIEEVKQTFLKGRKQNPSQDPRAEPEQIVQEIDKNDINEDQDAQKKDSRNLLLENSVVMDEAISNSMISNEEEVEETVLKEQEDTSQLMHMTQEAVQQLNEIKLKYELMNEFIHNHILEQKEQQISELLEENKKLETKVIELTNMLQSASNKPSEVEKKVESVNTDVATHKKKIGLARFLKRNHSENYILRLFSNPKFTAEQISEIRLGLEADLSESQIKSYAKQELTVKQMREIRMLYQIQNQKQRRG